jgi:hypothetical protein
VPNILDVVHDVPLLDGPPAVTDPALSEEVGPAIVELEEDGDGRIDQWREVERVFISAATARDFTTFVHLFSLKSRYKLRVQFYLVETSILGEQTEVNIGHAFTTLQNILDAPNERLDVGIISMDHAALVGRSSFCVDWIRDSSAILAFQVRIHVNRKEGWPFNSTRPFFMVYRLEYDGQWTPLYLSEVRVKATDHPEANGSMLYSIAEVDLITVNGGDDNRTLRIEFLQYKNAHPHHKLLGYVTTSVTALRQSAPNTDLNVQVNKFPSGELVGHVMLEKSRITSPRSFFSIQANFGGHVRGRFVYIDFLLASFDARFLRSSAFVSTRPHYQINRVNVTTGTWDVVYRSERSSKYPSRKLFKFGLAKVQNSKLCGDDTKRLFTISLHKSNATRIGYIKTSLDELVKLSSHSVLPVTFDTVSGKGFVQLDRKEVSADQTYLSLRAVLGQDSPTAMSDSASSTSSGAVVEYEMDDVMTTPDSSGDPTINKTTKPECANIKILTDATSTG